MLFSEEVDTDEGIKHKQIQNEVNEKNFQISQVKDSYTKKSAVVGMDIPKYLYLTEILIQKGLQLPTIKKKDAPKPETTKIVPVVPKPAPQSNPFPQLPSIRSKPKVDQGTLLSVLFFEMHLLFSHS